MSQQRQQILEYCTPEVVDGIIKNVKIIGTKSKNGHTYSLNVLKKSMPLYENAPVFICHPDPREKKTGSRRLSDHIGNLQGIRERIGQDGIFGDLQLRMSSPISQSILESLPDAKFGLSHNAVVRKSKDQKEVIEIMEINSVDIVDSPASTSNLFEEIDMNEDIQKLSDRIDELTTKISSFVFPPAEVIKEEVEVEPDPEPKKTKKRITALEDTELSGEDKDVMGRTHEDFLTALRGY